MINMIKNFIAKVDLKTLLILALICALLLTRMCSSTHQPSQPIIKIDGKKYEVVKHTIDTVIINKTQTLYRPGKIIYTDRPIEVKPPSIVDSLVVVNKYFSKIVYKDSLSLNDDGGLITVIDTVSQNMIIARQWKASIKQKIIHETTIVKELPKLQVYIGGVAGFDRANIVNFVGPSLIIKSKQDHIYSLGIGYGTQRTLSIQGGIYWKLRFKK